MERPERKFYFSLAEHLGMTVGQLLSGISSRELSEWQAYFILKEEDRKRAELEAKSQQGVKQARQSLHGNHR